MGLGTGSGGNTTFVQINGGRFKVKAKEGEEGAISRVNKNNETVWEHAYGTLSGHIVEIGTKDLGEQYGSILEVTLQDADGKYKVSLPFYKSQALTFLKKLPNVNPNEPVELSVWNVTEGTVTRTILNVKQNGVTVPQKWTKENEGELPKWEKVKSKIQGKIVEIWDSTEQFNYLIEKVALAYQHTLKDAKIPDFSKAPQASAPPKISDASKAPTEDEHPIASGGSLPGEDDDDLPF